MIPIKNPKEAEKMRLACRVASDILDRVVAIIRPGITTKEVDEAAAEMMQEAGVKSAFLGYRIGSRLSGKHLYFVKRRSHSRNCQSAANSVWRYRETRYRSHPRGLDRRYRDNGAGRHH